MSSQFLVSCRLARRRHLRAELVRLGGRGCPLFCPEDRPLPEQSELSQQTRNFLMAGMILQMHSESHAPQRRHVYVTTDLK